MPTRDVLLDAGPAGTLRLQARSILAPGVLVCHITDAKIIGTFTLEPAFDHGFSG